MLLGDPALALTLLEEMAETVTSTIHAKISSIRVSAQARIMT
jgi:hypothetical protein